MTSPEATAILEAGDIVPDLSLDQVKVDGRIPADADLLNHSAVAARVTELIEQSNHPANIAIFAPWGAGKSSLFGLMGEQLSDRGFNHVTFDAWKHAGDRFQANFLTTVSSQLGATSKGKKSRAEDPANALYQSRRQLQIPWMRSWPAWARLALVAAVFLTWVLLPPLLWAFHRNAWVVNDAYIPLYLHTLREWVVIALGGSLIAAVIGIIASVSQVTIEQSQPSSVKQFEELFNKILTERSDGKRTIIFIDELDRCEPKDVVATLDGLRTFLHHKDCIFVVAFDRDSVASAIGTQGAGRTDAEDSPYYLTAGEYLDKVFQFQVSLPPQTRHTLRTYATRLVESREGIWGALAAHSPDLLTSVVRLLAPAHISSPRRMKVLLNSFAVNMRLYQGFNFPAVERAEPIAVLTILQTEFPRFAADVEREPELLRAYAWKREPKRPRLLTLYEQWSDEGKAPELDHLVGKKSDSTKSARKAMLENLRAYLDRTVDMGAELPTPDLIHVHAGDEQQKFDDSGVYSALRLARDYPRQETLSELEGASQHDLIAGVRFLEHEIENSEIVEADGLRLIIGEILLNADDEVLAASERDAVDAWRSRREMPFPSRTGDLEPFFGFTRAFLTTAHVAAFDAFLADVEYVGNGGDSVLEYAIANASAEEWQRHFPAMLDRSITLLPVSSDAFTTLLIRFDEEPADTLPTDLHARLIGQLFPDEPEEPELAGLPPARQSAERQAYASTVETHNEHVEAAKELLPELVRLTVSGDGPVREMLLRAARTAEASMAEIAAVHDEVITGIDPQARDGLLLQAIADRPAERGRWLEHLSQTPQHPELVATALNSVLSATLKATFDERAGASLRIVRLAGGAVPNHTRPVEALSKLINRHLEDGNVSQFEPVRVALAAIDLLEPDTTVRRQIHVDVYVSAAIASTITSPQALATMLVWFRREDIDTVDSVRLALSERLNITGVLKAAAVLTLIAAQRFLIDHGRAIAPVPLTAVSPTFAVVPAIAEHWLYTRPRYVDVLKPQVLQHLPVGAGSEGMWGAYAEGLTENGRTKAWLALRRLRAPLSVLSAVSGGNREVSQELFAQLRETVVTSRLAVDKKSAFRVYKTLPLETRRAALSALILIRELAKTAVSAEFEIAAQAANQSRAYFYASETVEIRQLLSQWSPAAYKTLLAELRNSLFVNNLVERGPKKDK